MIVRSPSGHTVTFALPRDAGQYAAIATRLDLDSALVDRARKEGVVVVEGASLETLDDRNDGVTVHTSRGGFNARYVVAADGMWSPTRKALGLATPGYLGEWHAFRQYFSNVTGPASSHLVVSFEADLLPGYFWAFPLPDGRANVGFGIERGRKHRTRDMKQLWPDLLARPHLRELLGPDATPEGMHRAWPIPAQLSKVPSGTGRVLFVGDALSACDPMTGEGIGQALESGRLAAAALDGRWDRPVSVQEQYRELLSATLAADQRMSNLLMRALAHRKGVRSSVRLATPTTRTMSATSRSSRPPAIHPGTSPVASRSRRGGGTADCCRDRARSSNGPRGWGTTPSRTAPCRGRNGGPSVRAARNGACRRTGCAT